MMEEVPLYHQMNGGIHMNQLVTGKFIALKRKQKKSNTGTISRETWCF